MEEKSKEKLKDLLLRLKRVNNVFNKSNELQKGKLLEAIEPTVQELMEYGYDRDYLIGLLIGGKDFLISLGNVEGLDTVQAAELIFK